MIHRILAIDDSKLILNLHKLNIGSIHNVELEVATSGKEGLARLGEHAFDVVLLDLNMPDMDGLETLDRIRAHHGHVPVIIVSADAEEGRVREAMEKGATAFLKKPYTQKEVRALLDEIEKKTTPP